jgi:hypothetical protein
MRIRIKKNYVLDDGSLSITLRRSNPTVNKFSKMNQMNEETVETYNFITLGVSASEYPTDSHKNGKANISVTRPPPLPDRRLPPYFTTLNYYLLVY